MVEEPTSETAAESSPRVLTRQESTARIHEALDQLPKTGNAMAELGEAIQQERVKSAKLSRDSMTNFKEDIVAHSSRL